MQISENERSACSDELSLAMVVTTIITTYNHEKYIRQAIESALNQQGDFTHEILISDDASTDGTRAIVREYAAKYPQTVVDVSGDENLGISRNMRKCFARAKGRYVAMLEGDDYWTDSKKLAKQIEFLEAHTDCPMVFSRVQLNADGKVSLLQRHSDLPSRLTVGDILECECMNPICNFSCCLFRREFLRVIPDCAYEGRLSEVTVAFFMAQIAPVGYLKEVMSDYRIHGDGTFAGADAISQCQQAIQTFQTVRKVLHSMYWPRIGKVLEGLESRLHQLKREGRPLFSVVTVTYQNIAGLRRTAASIREQTFGDFEWIVIDGGSADGTRQCLETMERAPDRWVSEPDGGVYAAMNKGIGMARGVYVICMNAGDAFRAPGTLQEVADCNPDKDVVYGDWVRVYSDGREEYMLAPKALPKFYFLRPKCNICHQAIFVRTQLLQESGFDEEFYIAADLSKWRHFMFEGRSFQKVNVTVCNFEAGTGLSERQTYRNVLDTIRLQNEFSVGLVMQVNELDAWQMSIGKQIAFVDRWMQVIRVALWPARKAYRGLKCLKENGWAYTVKNVRMKARRLCCRVCRK